MNENMRIILEKIKEYDKILIFRHFRPDGDAIGSTKGFAEILKNTYPEKKIYLQNADFSAYLAFLGPEDELLPTRNIKTRLESYSIRGQRIEFLIKSTRFVKRL